MNTLERGRRYESLDKNIVRIASAYGFSAPPITISRKAVANVGDEWDIKTAVAMALMKTSTPGKTPKQSWGLMRKKGGTVITFAVTSSKQAIAHAIVVKTALSVAELAGYTNLSVLISSVGDQESRKRFTRELTNFFRKHHASLDPELRHVATQNPDVAYRKMLLINHAVLSRTPRSIDYLSESSRKTMLGTLSLFESVRIPYTIETRLTAVPHVQSELLFAIEGIGKGGERTRIANGARYDEHLKREYGKDSEGAIAISVEVPKIIACEAPEEEPACFVVHVGDAAQLRAFQLLEALWRAHIAVGQALMAENFRDQMQKGAVSKTKYLAIVGQREALDNTVIVRSVSTQMQTVLPLEKLSAYVSRGHR